MIGSPLRVGFALFLGLVVVVGSGCFLRKIDLIERGNVEIEKTSTVEHFPVSQVRVVQHREVVRVSGIVEAFPPSRNIPLGHVDITITLNNGKSIKKFVDIHTSSSRWARNRFRRARFSEEFPLVLSAGAKVHIKYHELFHLKGCPSFDEGC